MIYTQGNIHSLPQLKVTNMSLIELNAFKMYIAACMQYNTTNNEICTKYIREYDNSTWKKYCSGKGKATVWMEGPFLFEGSSAEEAGLFPDCALNFL